jgi:hypothetical protein
MGVAGVHRGGRGEIWEGGVSNKPEDCPRCHEACGWCGDYRHMHGKVRLPGSRQYCTIAKMHPDPVCEICGGSRLVFVTRTYAPAQGAPT